MGEEFMKVISWPFGDMLFPEKDTSGKTDEAPANTQQTGALTSTPSTEDQAQQRRLARLSKYFTTPTGVLQSNTGSTGVF